MNRVLQNFIDLQDLFILDSRGRTIHHSIKPVLDQVNQKIDQFTNYFNTDETVLYQYQESIVYKVNKKSVTIIQKDKKINVKPRYIEKVNINFNDKPQNKISSYNNSFLIYAFDVLDENLTATELRTFRHVLVKILKQSNTERLNVGDSVMFTRKGLQLVGKILQLKKVTAKVKVKNKLMNDVFDIDKQLLSRY